MSERPSVNTSLLSKTTDDAGDGLQKKKVDEDVDDVTQKKKQKTAPTTSSELLSFGNATAVPETKKTKPNFDISTILPSNNLLLSRASSFLPQLMIANQQLADAAAAKDEQKDDETNSDDDKTKRIGIANASIIAGSTSSAVDAKTLMDSDDDDDDDSDQEQYVEMNLLMNDIDDPAVQNLLLLQQKDEPKEEKSSEETTIRMVPQPKKQPQGTSRILIQEEMVSSNESATAIKIQHTNATKQHQKPLISEME